MHAQAWILVSVVPMRVPMRAEGTARAGGARNVQVLEGGLIPIPEVKMHALMEGCVGRGTRGHHRHAHASTDEGGRGPLRVLRTGSVGAGVGAGVGEGHGGPL
eukprot:3713974-Rhodomonas_salina.5